jgi:prolyl oligopeptidase PreP (S9A serine peptidase family)
VSKLFEKRRRRTGYDADAPMVLYKTLHFDEFMKAHNPFPLFLEYNKLELTEDEKVKYAAMAKLPPDFEELCSDIQVIGKREVL